ncbi:hypothetical protein LSH36_72g06046 [Paralvinella palmiformis]|uniref:B box-type domain-containing protein n=1 Tax=Paralvinella palmiformis TaxID=53620 RepID=A0AAD9K381_9ANNE|nr:hypothetical protein LSH36_72g06046 [Paralvinella palmiformis]
MASLKEKQSNEGNVQNESLMSGEVSTEGANQNGCRPKRKTKIAQKPGKRDHGLCAVCCEIGQSSGTTSYCFDCGRTMCEMCDLNHQQISAFKAHAKVSLCVDETQKLCPKKLDALICKDHDRMVRKYCWDCQKPVCNACLARKHHRHTIKTFAIKTAEDQKRFDELQALIQHKMAELEAKMEQIETIKEKHRQNFRMLEEMISSHRDNMCNQVMVQKEQLEAELNRRQDEKKGKLKTLIDKATIAQRVMNSLQIQARIATIRKAKMEASKTDHDEDPSEPQDNQQDPTICKCCNENVTVAESLAAEAEAPQNVGESGGPLAGAAAALDQSQDIESILQSYNFELVPHEDPDVTLAYVRSLSEIVGAHIDSINREVQQTKDEMTSLRFKPGTLDFSIGRIEMPDFKVPDYEQELEEIRQLAEKLKGESVDILADSVSVAEVSIRDLSGAVCENPFK